jgi:hypothetical protein
MFCAPYKIAASTSDKRMPIMYYLPKQVPSIESTPDPPRSLERLLQYSSVSFHFLDHKKLLSCGLGSPSPES